MTNHWIDYRNSDVLMNIGGNTAENHPISMKWIEHARTNRGAKLIVVDPRITRTAAVADLHVPIRPGTNIAYLGGLMSYIMEHDLCQEEYVKYYTNASYLLQDDFDWDDETGLFSGAEDDAPDKPIKYSKDSWAYRKDAAGNVLKDLTLQDPRCVYQVMKQFYSRYTLEMVSKITGCDTAVLEESYQLYGSTGAREKAGNLMYAMGITQFTHGAQNVRACAMVQLLLGNMGIPGGGVNAQRGQSNVQGSTDMAIMYHIIPGYLSAPKAAVHPTLADYNEKETPAKSWWVNKPKYLASMLKAFWGDHATPENDFCYDFLPKLDNRDHSHIGMYKFMGEGEVKGMICWADNPAVSGPSSSYKRGYQGKLDWLVGVDIFENETCAFWKAPGANPAEIDTEVFMLPATSAYEREGTVANSGRWIQWRWKGQQAPGECRSDLQIAFELFKRLQEAYAADAGAVFPDPITKMKWDYADDTDPDKVDIVKVCKDLNGYTVADGKLLTNFVGLQDDGSTACGNWLYSGYYNNYENPACK
ncbi:MAG: molybdopterin-dependent oxidoreductase, partial [Firmicutes bacterium]|nr:molybdopterin-dependent oxidoreductase [Bacillota bacterium]